MKIKYNAPVTLTISLSSSLILLINDYLYKDFIVKFFKVSGREFFDWDRRVGYYQLVSHILGHMDWKHLTGNVIYILLLGPILEERFGSPKLFGMIFFTALATGLLNARFFDTAVMGASGIVFMMITLISIVNIRKDEIPLSLILIFILYLSQELIGLFNKDSISQFSHIAGGILGIFYGFLVRPRNAPRKTTLNKKPEPANFAKK